MGTTESLPLTQSDPLWMCLISFHPNLGSFLKRGAGTANPRLAHVSPEAVGVVAHTPMQDAAVVPKNSVAGLPSLGPAVFRLGREIVEFVD